MSYIVPVHRPSGVRHAIKLSFTSSDEDTLVVAKANRLEIYTQSSTEGLTLQHTRTVYGYITMLSGLRPASATTDHLFVGTDRYQYFTCSWDAANKQIKTEQSYVDQADKSLRDSKESDRCHVDPTGRYMALDLYDGVVTVIPIVQPSTKRQKRSASTGTAEGNVNTLGEPVQVRIEQTLTRDSAFLDVDADNTENPRLAILWEDNDSNPQLCLRELKQGPGGDPSNLDLVTVAELRADLDPGVTQLVPVSSPCGGFLVLGETSIAYVDKDLNDLHVQPLHDDSTIFTCWTKVDENRWLLGDDYGKLFFLMIEFSDGRVSGWKLDSLGEASRAACLVYLDEGVVFVGSHSGDSQVVRIVQGGVEVLQTFSNIAPILDFTIMDLGRGADTSQTNDFSSGQARVVAASGAWQDGSIRSVRSGVGMEELGTIGEISLISDMWAIDSRGSSTTHDTLIATFANETRVFKFDSEGEVAEVDEFKNLNLTQATIFVANLPNNRLLQVHEAGVEMTDLESGMSIFQWRPPDAESKITSAVANGAHLLVVQGGHTLYVFHVSGQTVSEPTSKSFPTTSQISSVSVPDSQSNVGVVAFWQTASVAILDLHTLEPIQTQILGEPGRAVPRSVLVAQVLPEAPPTLFIAMADGTVITYSFDLVKNTLSSMTRILLGTEPVVFKGLPSTTTSGHSVTNVFASCEQPSLIYASEGRVIYSAVNADSASRVCYFNTVAYPGAVALATPSELKLGLIGSTRTTQLQTLPVAETVRCLAYEPQAKVFGIGCVRRIVESGVEALMSSVKLADEVGFQELDSVELNDNELIECIVSFGSMSGDDENEEDESAIFVVGTSMIIEDDGGNAPEERGRMIVYQVDQRRHKLKVMTEIKLKGACRSLAVYEGKIVAGLVKVVALYSLAPSKSRGGKYSYELQRIASYRTSTNPLSIHIQPPTDSQPAIIGVGDLMKSISLVSIIPPEESETETWRLVEVGRHFATVWTSSVAGVGEHEWLLADMEGNLLMLRRNIEAVTADERKRLEVVGELRLGEVVNKIVPIAQATSGQGMTNTKGKERSRTLSSAPAPAVQNPSNSRASRVGPLIQPQAFIATVEGAIYMLGAIGPNYIDALLRLQSALASKVQAPGYMPWTRYRAWKTEVREGDEPFRFVDGELIEAGLLTLSNEELESVMRENGLTHEASGGGLELSVEEVRSWGEQLRRLY